MKTTWRAGVALIGVLLVLAMGGHGFGSIKAEAAGGVYPPKAPCSVGVSFWYDGDDNVPGYEACDVAGVDGLADQAGSMVCPAFTRFSADDQGCVPSDGHQPWRDSADLNVACPGDMDEQACSDWLGSQTESGQTGDDGGKGVYPVIKTASLDHDVQCYSGPSTDTESSTLPAGQDFNELADGQSDQMQMVQPFDRDGVCYVQACDFDMSCSNNNDGDQVALTGQGSDETQVSVDNSGADTASNVDTTVNSSTEAGPVTTLPNTGIGPGLSADYWSMIGYVLLMFLAVGLSSLGICLLGGLKLRRVSRRLWQHLTEWRDGLQYRFGGDMKHIGHHIWVQKHPIPAGSKTSIISD